MRLHITLGRRHAASFGQVRIPDENAMTYDEALAVRIRRALGPRDDIDERKMFGGLAFLRDGKMFCGIVKDELMVRVGPERYQASLAKAHVRPMDFTGRPMVGYVFVGASGHRTARSLKTWVDLGDSFVATLARKMNGAWHQRHPMPKNPTAKQRVAWHEAHEQQCGCRPMPAELRAKRK